MNDEAATYVREILDLRDEVRNLADQVRNDADYLRVLLKYDALSAEWRERVEARLEWMTRQWPKLFLERKGE